MHSYQNAVLLGKRLGERPEYTTRVSESQDFCEHTNTVWHRPLWNINVNCCLAIAKVAQYWYYQCLICSTSPLRLRIEDCECSRGFSGFNKRQQWFLPHEHLKLARKARLNFGKFFNINESMVINRYSLFTPRQLYCELKKIDQDSYESVIVWRMHYFRSRLLNLSCVSVLWNMLL